MQAESIPEPKESVLNEASKAIGFILDHNLGITFRFGIYIGNDYWDNESLITYELPNTLQYERWEELLIF